uniref:Dual specificity protein phosphatase n=1 Tax=Paramormyrops kingsleyae TaxID=1676925 RepID=A0A3B3SH14_9TELE|nr:dual specificity protein phosphatase 13-like [Paramormyrops kingsleyae]
MRKAEELPWGQSEESARHTMDYETPPISELQRMLQWDFGCTGPINQVWPGVYIGNAAAARDKPTLRDMGITHIVNSAHGPLHINTGARFYRELPIHYYGVEADDAEDFDLSPFFYPTAKFIRAALSQYGRVLVHCAMGLSRSATLVLAYLMICEGLPLLEAIRTVRKHRDICPNSGFLEQLRRLDMALEQERRSARGTKKL